MWEGLAKTVQLSPPSRGAWIEIDPDGIYEGEIGKVAPLAGGVD